MRQIYLAASLFLLSTGLFSSPVTADETTFGPDRTEQSVFVRCHGRLRHGVVAVGGETTGTTMTFHGITWELQLPDDASREFASQHHQKPVIVNGTLRHVAGIEISSRWIVDVSDLSEPESRDVPQREVPGEGAQITIRGILRAALSQTSQKPELSVRLQNQNWHLDLPDDGATPSRAESLIGELVRIRGSLKTVPEEGQPTATRSRMPAKPTVQVSAIEAAAETETDTGDAAPD